MTLINEVAFFDKTIFKIHCQSRDYLFITSQTLPLYISIDFISIAEQQRYNTSYKFGNKIILI